MPARRFHLLIVAMFVTGCAAHHSLHPTSITAQKSPVHWDAKANLKLDQIQPVPQLSSPTTQPQERAPIEALVLYGQSRDASVRGQTSTAIDDLQRAISIDPYRYDLRFDLGLAYANANNTEDNAIHAFEKAAQLEPDHLDLQTELGKLYLDKSNYPAAIEHLRLAMQTADYSSNEGQAAVNDFYLARALKESGYDRAALNQYTVLLQRFDQHPAALQQNAELAYLLERPELLFVQIGELLEKHGEYGQAVTAFRPAVEREPDNFELQSRYARDLAFDGQQDAALAKAVDLVVRDRATPQSLTVLRDVCQALNQYEGVVRALRKLSNDRPGDQAVLFALTDTLISKHRSAEAQKILTSAWQKSPDDIGLTRRLFVLEKNDNAVDSAARLLISAFAHNPDAMNNYSPLSEELLRPGQPNRLTLAQLQDMTVSSGDEPSRQFWIAKTAADEGRRTVERTALESATDLLPPFTPAFRARLELIWIRPDLTGPQKIDAMNHLVDVAKANGDAALSAELRGRMLMKQNRSYEAIDAFALAVRLGGRSSDLILAGAEAGHGMGRDPQYEQILWKLISDRPLYEDGYTALFQYYAKSDTGSIEQALKVLSTWLISDPQSITARVSQAKVDMQLGQMKEAEQGLDRLYADDADNTEVFLAMRQFYAQTNRTNELIGKLEDQRAGNPRDIDVVARLVSLYAEQKRNAEAVRLVDTTRAAVPDDADLLYSLSGLYQELGQKQTAEEVLQQIVLLNPTHAGASNDLGFAWADEGQNLPRAESLIRVAVSAEPDNESFLDSLGWVLYKRGQFDEARKYLEQAIGPSASPDPAVLDHLGDTLYRLSKPDEAQKTWQKSLQGLGDGDVDRDDMKQLRLRLLQKIKQVEAKKSVDVAPVKS